MAKEDADQNLFGETLDEPPATKTPRREEPPVDPAVLAAVTHLADVALPIPPPARDAYSYCVPTPLVERVAIGHRAEVTLNNRPMVGVVTGVRERDPAEDLTGYKFLEALPDAEPLVTPDLMELTRWMAQYYGCAWGEALETALPASVRRTRGGRTVTIIQPHLPPGEEDTIIAQLEGDTRTQKQAKVLRTLVTFPGPFGVEALIRRLGFTRSPVQSLAKRGLVRFTKVPISPVEDPIADLDFGAQHLTLTPEQRAALDSINAGLRENKYRTFLLHGVTGSGKTEVYIRAIETALAQGRSAIILVPEIALTPQTMRRFAARFDGVALLHSALTDRERREQWRAIRSGERRVVVGPRSAVFAPVERLGLIVVDEEHEPSFKQQNTPRYHARDVAIKRAADAGAVTILGSATPSLETRANAETGKYGYLTLTIRVADRPMPEVRIIDQGEECRVQRRYAVFSRLLEDELATRLERGDQAILFLNRRGYHTAVTCPACGEALRCDSCDIGMTYHRGLDRAVCHYCYAVKSARPPCPACGHERLSYTGLGTEQVERAFNARFPDKVCARMDSDTMTSRSQYEETLTAFRHGSIDVLVGTQMIAKGLDFPRVTLVGVISADGALHLPDFRARERTFQLLAQVAGRAGRGDVAGLVVVQTFNPQEPAIQLAARHDYEAFFHGEIRDRRTAGYPPFRRLVLITAEGPQEEQAADLLRDWRARLNSLEAMQDAALLGPAPAPIAQIRDRYRWQIMLKFPARRASVRVQEVFANLRRWPVPRQVRITLDVDPFGVV